MTRRQLLRRLEHWRSRLVPEWRITVMEAGPEWKDEESFLATCQTAEDYHHVKVYFTDECLAMSDADVDVTIVHELLHPLARELRRILDQVEDHVPPALHQALRATQETAEEQFVDRISRAIVHADRGEWPVFGILER